MLCLQNAATKTQPESRAAVSVEAHRDFFRSLVRDESLREALTARPLETLAAFGIYLDAAQVPANVNLPSDQALAAFVGPATYWIGYF